MRVHAHPALLSALKHLRNHTDFLEKFSPTAKTSGFFYFDSVGLARPEITHYRNRLTERYTPPADAKVLLLVPQTRNKPFHKAPEFKKIRQLQRSLDKELSGQVHICVYSAPFGLVPLELDEVYPLSQHETAHPHDSETVEYVAEQTAQYIKRTTYQSVVLLNDPKHWSDKIKKATAKASKTKEIPFASVDANVQGNRETFSQLEHILREQLA
jgi:7-cyano-7-deazaguanine tRNA-ribosyltransferase